MKALFTILLCASLSLSIAQDSTGKLGDVKYSVLDPDKFADENGQGWVIMMGQAINGSDLHVLSGIATLPDARGRFIRSLNLGRADGGDPDVNRLVGSAQEDALQDHKHNYRLRVFGGEYNDRGLPTKSEDNDGAEVTWTTHGANGANLAAETRPKNIALYTYIKINN